MIIKSKKMLLFNPDSIAVEYVTGLQYYYYLIAYKNGKKFYIEGFKDEKKGIEKLNNINEAIKKGQTYLEI